MSGDIKIVSKHHQSWEKDLESERKCPIQEKEVSLSFWSCDYYEGKGPTTNKSWRKTVRG
jgi:hypothetical protein